MTKWYQIYNQRNAKLAIQEAGSKFSTLLQMPWCLKLYQIINKKKVTINTRNIILSRKLVICAVVLNIIWILCSIHLFIGNLYKKKRMLLPQLIMNPLVTATGYLAVIYYSYIIYTAFEVYTGKRFAKITKLIQIIEHSDISRCRSTQG
ncbi:uncharacterized protein LOC143249116 [Tachypleus tridentatus]|uniref:uncharacterized protein LOC143249116 n=1 Tax=Tachypleus tridentatus TaxID=6853 RepID=UPI003FD3A017